MKAVCLSAVLRFGLLCFTGSPCVGGVADGSMESILVKWEDASQKCHSLNAAVTIFHYDVFSGDHPQVTRGRLYCETPHVGRYEIWVNEQGSTTNDWSKISEAIVWKDDETLLIDGRARSCKRVSKARLEYFARESEADWSYSFCRLVTRPWRGPQYRFPLLMGVRASEVQERFDVAIDNTDGQIRLKAVPKQKLDKAAFKEIDVILDTTTYLVYAMRIVSVDGIGYMDFVFTDQKVNQRPSDRDQLINPSLVELRVTDFP
jgi:hypothetical protein